MPETGKILVLRLQKEKREKKREILGRFLE
jgi:hypothetical protein